MTPVGASPSHCLPCSPLVTPAAEWLAPVCPAFAFRGARLGLDAALTAPRLTFALVGSGWLPIAGHLAILTTVGTPPWTR